MTAASSQRCSECGSSSFEVDSARGDSVCVECGAVQEAHKSQFMVSSIEFQETGFGAKQAVGSYVDADGFAKFNTGMHGGTAMSSKAVSFANARRIIEGIAIPMHISGQIIDMAHNFYKMCYSRNMTRGRKLKILCSACVYISCRLELTSHMLSDFCGAAQANVSVLGRYFSIISSALNIKLPLIDPSLFIPRFAEKLEFGDRTMDIISVATNLVAGMQRDWMSTGRRPSGLCASALLIAARLYGFHRTIDDVLKIFKIHKMTLIKRLEEFTEMPASSLSYNETININDELSSNGSIYSVKNPPCLNFNLETESSVVSSGKREKMEEEVLAMKDEIDQLIEKQIMKKESTKTKDPKDSDPSAKTQILLKKSAERNLLDEVIQSDLDDSEVENAILANEEVEARQEILDDILKDTSDSKTNANNNPSQPSTEDEDDESGEENQNLDDLILKQLNHGENNENEPKRLKLSHNPDISPQLQQEEILLSPNVMQGSDDDDDVENSSNANDFTGDPNSFLATAQYL